MRVVVYMILTGPELPIGTAYDRTTFLSLVELAKLKGALGLTLYGSWEDGHELSGEISVEAASDLALSKTVTW